MPEDEKEKILPVNARIGSGRGYQPAVPPPGRPWGKGDKRIEFSVFGTIYKLATGWRVTNQAVLSLFHCLPLLFMPG